jgi:sulfur carrier protein
MKVIVNGEVFEAGDSALTVARLLQLKEVESPDMVSVQLNGEVIDRGLYETTPVAADDEIEFLYFMGGGARP